METQEEKFTERLLVYEGKKTSANGGMLQLVVVVVVVVVVIYFVSNCRQKIRDTVPVRLEMNDYEQL